MDKRPLLTIITVTFQAEKFLGRTLDSVARARTGVESPAQLEYLIIDGGSKDQTLAIAERYPFISKIISEKDKGLYDAMNKGLRLASGKYVWFLNAGDEAFDSNTLSSLLSALETGAAVYYSDAMMVREDGTEVGLRSQFTPHTLPEKLRWQDFALGMKVCHQAFIARKDIAPFYEYARIACRKIPGQCDTAV